MFKPHEVCKILGISKSTLLRWEANGRISKSARKLSGSRTYTVTDLKSIFATLPVTRKRYARLSILQSIKELHAATSSLEELLATAE